MKNIFLFPTEEQIEKEQSKIGGFINTKECSENEMPKLLNQNIYIISDEEIREGDWVCDIELDRVEKCQHSGTFRNWKKIILTTNPILITDGIQSITDDFLKWFVDNPTCEEVNIFEKSRCCGRCMGVFADLCYSDMTCYDHKELGCEICYGKRVEYIINIPIVGVFSEGTKEDFLISDLKITELTALVETWKQKQRHYENEAEKHRSSEHTYKKYTYRAQATRDCWKELSSLIKKL